MVKKIGTNHTGDTPATGNLNALARLLTPETAERARMERERKEAERLEQEKHDAIYEAHCNRWLKRIERWAMKQSRDDLAERFSLALLLLVETRKTSRFRAALVSKWSELAIDAGTQVQAARAVAKDSIRKELMQTAARREGAMRKLANDPKQAAKAKAYGLYSDWQAGRLRFANQAAFSRHVCDSLGLKDIGNVGKWCREWRKHR